MVLDNGTIDLGSRYRSLHVAGMTIDETRAAIDVHLQRVDGKRMLRLSCRKLPDPPVKGQCLVGTRRDDQSSGSTARPCRWQSHPGGRSRDSHPTQFATVSLTRLRSPSTWRAYNSKVYYSIQHRISGQMTLSPPACQ